MVNLAIYVRVSTSQQTYSRQVDDIKKYISIIYSEGNYNIEVYAENISGFRKSQDRPELKRFLSKVELEPTFYKCLYVTELSRVGRNPIEARIVVTELLEKGIDVCVTSSNGGQNFLNQDGTIDKTKFAVLGLLMDFAQIEVDQFKSRTASGLKEKVFKGGTTGGLLQPFGYAKDENKKLVIDQEESKVIEYIFEQYSQGLGMGHIANQLNEQGIQTRTNKAFEGKSYKGKDADKIKWTGNQILVILTNSIYCGQRIFKKRKRTDQNGNVIDNSEVFDAPDTAIITKELFDECTEIRLGKKGNGRNIHTKNVILLQYHTKCGVCGRNFTHRVFDGIQNYICSSRVVSNVKPCKNLGVNIDLVDSSIYDILCSSESVIKYLNDTDSIKKEISNKISLLEASLPSLEKSYVTNEKKIDNLVNLMLEDDTPNERYKSKIKELEATSANFQFQIDVQRKQLASNQKSLKNLSKSTLDNKILKEAKDDRNKLKAIYKQIIKNVTFTAINFQFIRLDLTLQINGVELEGTLKVVVSRKGLRKKPFKYQYQQEYIPPFDSSQEEIDDYLERFYDNQKFEYKTLEDYNKIVRSFQTIEENIINIREL